MELLPDTQTPSWLGLPNNAERVLLTTQGESLLVPLLLTPLGGEESSAPSGVCLAAQAQFWA